MDIQTVDRLRLLIYLMKIDLILAIETSSTICGVAVIEKERTLSVVEKSADRKHAEILPEFIEIALEKSQKTVGDLERYDPMPKVYIFLF